MKEHPVPYEIEKQHYDQHGFVIVRKLLGDAEFAVLRENLVYAS